ncbi:MAG TPA: hypothetical protein VGP41_15120 [Candidatus Lustribacter sp.]|nr:hypothetical protein [Candidatus Lustribacter sp.]
MPEPSLLPERIFGLSAVDGRRAVRPGEVIHFRFRAKNGSEVPTPPALLVLVLPPGWSPLDPLEADIPSVAPGAEHSVGFRARPDVADATTAQSPIQAALHLDTLVLGSNVVHMRVFGHPRLNGPASGVRIEPAEGGALRVAVTVVNEGDAAARAVRAVVPPPPGFGAEESAIVATVDELPVGGTLSFAYTMLPLGPAAATVCIDDAYIAYDGGRVSLMTGVSALLAPEIAEPAIEAERRAGRLDLRIRVANDGWVAARDVRCALDLPAGWRVLRGTMRADGAPPAIRRDNESENGVAIALPLVPARGFVDITVVASASRPRVEGDLTVRCGSHTVAFTIPQVAQRALRLDARPESAFAEPGSVVAVAVDVHNTGETSERVTVSMDEEPCWNGELRAGAAAAFVARLTVPAHLGDADVMPVAITAAGEDGIELAATQFELRTVDRPWIAIDDVVWERGQTRVTIRNVGATTARDVRLDGETDVLVAALAPGETYSAVVAPGVARAASIVGHDGRAVRIGWDDQAPPVDVAAQLVAPATARSGERLDVRLRITGAGAVQSLRVRPRAHAAAVYVAGSTTVNGHAVVDGIEGPPLFTRNGLALHDIPAGTLVDIGWSLLPRTPGELPVDVEIDANGTAVNVEPFTVTIADAPPFGARPSALPFFVDATTVGDFSVTAPYTGEAALLPTPAPAETAIDALPAPPDPSGPQAWTLAPPDVPTDETSAFPARQGPTVTAWLSLDAVRAASIVRVLRGARGPGMIGHVPSLAVLFPNGIASGDPALDATFARTSEAVRGIFERLFVKLRIPGYSVTPGDFEDAATRRELLALLDGLGATNDPGTPLDSRADVYVRIDRNRLLAARAALADAPLGGPQTLAAIAALLPRYGAGDAAVAVGTYAGELATTFDAACALGQAEFTAYLTTQRAAELDSARAVAVAVLDAHNELASP